MTLIAAFRCHEGVVICADSQETIGDWRAPVKKIIHKDVGEYQVAVGGAGDDGALIDVFVQRFIEEVERKVEMLGCALRLGVGDVRSEGMSLCLIA